MTKHTAIERSQRPPSTADLEACGPAGDAAAERITLYFSTEIDQFIETKYSVFGWDWSLPEPLQDTSGDKVESAE